MSQITREQASTALRKQVAAMTTLTGFARYIDIPGVPMDGDVSDREFEVIDTPLATHHIVMLNAMQLMAQGLLMVDRKSLKSPVFWSMLRGESEPPAGVESKVGASIKASPPLTQIENRTPSVQESGDTDPNISAPELYKTDTDLSFEPISVVLRSVLSGDLPELDARKLVYDLNPELYSCRRVMLMLPPGSAKSTYASVVFPAWVMGRNRMFEMILTGWGDPICRRHGKRARQVCASPQFRALFDTDLDPNTKAAEDWALRNLSSYKSSGITSGISGFRAHGLIWDDLVKNRKDADSQTIRNDIWNEYIDSARSRKTPKAWEVGIGTRWHEDEHMGRILPEGYSGESGFIEGRDGNVWFVICMAAECERDDDPLGRKPGEMIWPDWFDFDYWAQMRRNPRSWASLYQQRPSPEEGLMFKREMFKRYDVLPEGDDYICYDPGVSEHGDPTAMHHWRVDDQARLYLVSRWYRRCTMDVWIAQLLKWVKDHKPIEAVTEAGTIRRAAEPFIQRAMRKARVFFSQSWVTRSANKPAMAQAALAMVNSGQVYVPNNSDGDTFIELCMKFPSTTDDHDVDAFANLCLRLEAIWEANPPRDEEEKRVIIDGSFGGEEMKVSQFMPPRFPKRKSRWQTR